MLIESDVPALWVEASLKGAHASYSKNFVDLRTAHAAEVQITLDKPITPYECQQMLEIRSVYDIAAGMLV